jgi:two-component system, OmpR family, sensor histidine kinase KdpD
MIVVVPVALAFAAAALIQTVRVHRLRAVDSPVPASDDQIVSASEAASLANLAHELRTPLTSIIGYVKMLRRRADVMTPEQRSEYLAICDRLAQRQLRLVESLLESARLEEGTPLRRERLDLQVIVRETVEGLGGVVAGHHVVQEVPSYDLRLYGNPDAVEHALSNLIENAAKYAQAGTRITVRVREVGDEVLVSVADQGPGIPSSDLPHVFDRGRRLANDSERPGAGLGLSIVRALVNAHGGRIWAESTEQGATISFTLPRRAGDSLSTVLTPDDAKVLRRGSITRDAVNVMRVVR